MVQCPQFAHPDWILFVDNRGSNAIVTKLFDEPFKPCDAEEIQHSKRTQKFYFKGMGMRTIG